MKGSIAHIFLNSQDIHPGFKGIEAISGIPEVLMKLAGLFQIIV
jgi:hypothetical protein